MTRKLIVLILLVTAYALLYLSADGVYEFVVGFDKEWLVGSVQMIYSGLIGLFGALAYKFWNK